MYEISFHLNAYLRTIAIKREVYYINLKSWEDRRDKTVNYWNDLSNMTSISPSIEGIIVKIAGFFGIGAGAALLSKNPTLSIFENPLFFIGGLLGLVGIIILIKWLANREIKKAYHFNASMQQMLWKEKAYNDYKESLSSLLEKISKVTQSYYPNYNEDVLTVDKSTYVENMMPSKYIHHQYHRATFIKNIKQLHQILDGVLTLDEIEPKTKKKQID